MNRSRQQSEAAAPGIEETSGQMRVAAGRNGSSALARLDRTEPAAEFATGAEKGAAMFLRRFSVVVLFAAFLPLANAADGTNKLVNGTFDTDVSGWTPIGDPVFEWDPKDADNRPNSGSALLTILAPGPTTKCVRQCSDVLEGDMEYRMRAMLNNPIGQTGLGWGDIRLIYYAEPNCSGLNLGGGFVCQVLSTGADEWLECAGNQITHADAQSAFVSLCVSMSTVTGTLGIAFDNVNLFSSEVMEANFESGDFSGWSAVYP